MGWVSVASAWNSSSCAHSWPRPQKSFPCPVAAHPDSGLGEPLSTEPGAPACGGFSWPPSTPPGAVVKGRGIYQLHDLLQRYLVVSWVLLRQGPAE